MFRIVPPFVCVFQTRTHKWILRKIFNWEAPMLCINNIRAQKLKLVKKLCIYIMGITLKQKCICQQAQKSHSLIAVGVLRFSAFHSLFFYLALTF